MTTIFCDAPYVSFGKIFAVSPEISLFSIRPPMILLTVPLGIFSVLREKVPRQIYDKG